MAIVYATPSFPKRKPGLLAVALGTARVRWDSELHGSGNADTEHRFRQPPSSERPCYWPTSTFLAARSKRRELSAERTRQRIGTPDSTQFRAGLALDRGGLRSFDQLLSRAVPVIDEHHPTAWRQRRADSRPERRESLRRDVREPEAEEHEVVAAVRRPCEQVGPGEADIGGARCGQQRSSTSPARRPAR
jgi:hypothetical protein